MSGNSPASFRYVELFAGVGGFGVACRRLGGRCVLASEIEPTAKAAWVSNFPEDADAMRGDVTAIDAADVPDHDVLVGGFPCQPFSRAGAQPATSVDKGQLYMHIVRIAAVKRPRLMLLENVPGLATAESGGGALRKVVAALEGAGYAVTCGIVDSALLVPQRRRRLYIVATAAGVPAFRWPQVPADLARSLGEVLEEAAKAAPFTLDAAQWRRRLEICPRTELWLADTALPGPTLTRGYRRAPGKAAGKRWIGSTEDRSASSGARDAEGRRAAATGPGGWRNLIADPDAQEAAAPRFLTARECARMHGFPESFKLPREADPHGPSTALMGNAVSPPVILLLLAAMLSTPAVPEGTATPVVHPELHRLLLDAVPPTHREQLAARIGESATTCEVEPVPVARVAEGPDEPNGQLPKAHRTE